MLDEGEVMQVHARGDEHVERVELRPAPERAQQRSRDPGAAAAEPVGEALLQAAFKLEHGVA